MLRWSAVMLLTATAEVCCTQDRGTDYPRADGLGICTDCLYPGTSGIKVGTNACSQMGHQLT